MKKLFFKILIFVFILTILNIFLLEPESQAQWQQMGGPYRGFVYSIFSWGDNLYSGTYGGGVYRSTNNGVGWFASNNGLLFSGTEIKDVYVNKNKLFACSVGRGIFCSSDSGKNWVQSNNGLTNLNVNVFFANGTKKIFAGTDYGLYYSTNNGNDWQITGLTYHSICCMTSLGNNLFAGTEGDGMFRSTNSGLNWTAVNNILPNLNINSIAVSGTTIFAGIQANGIYKSTNNGDNWTLLTYGVPGPIDFDWLIYKNKNNLYVANGNRLIKSTNNGVNWNIINNNPGNSSIRDICFKDSTIWLGTDFGVWSSSNNGLNWIYTNEGFSNELIICFTTIGSTVYGGSEGYGLYRSTNSGLNWTHYALFDKSVFSLTTCGTYLFAGTVLGGGVYRSSDNGENWVSATNGITNNSILRMATKGNCIFAGTDNGVFRSTNLGDNWVALNSTMQIYPVYALTVSDSFVYAGVAYAPGGIFKSSNNGDNWVSISNGLTNIDIRSILADGNKLYTGTKGGVFVSTNNGEMWNLIGLSNMSTYSLIKQATYLIAGTDSGAYVYDATFKKWNSLNDGFCDAPWVYTFTKCNDYLLAGTVSQSVWRRSLSNIIGINNSTEIIPSKYKLFQNYPNPFNPSTKVQFTIPNVQFVTLKIYDILGKEVAILVKEKLAPGTHEATFDGTNLPSGIYFYKLDTPEFSKTMRMVLVK